MIKVYKVNPNRLTFKEMQQVDFNISIPILINEKKEVICGNCCKDMLLKRNIIEVIVLYGSNSFVENTLYNIETEVVKEDITRFYLIENDIKKYLRQENNTIETISLFEVKENNCIDESSFVKPPPYNFKKHKKKDKTEEIDLHISLFDFGGDDQ